MIQRVSTRTVSLAVDCERQHGVIPNEGRTWLHKIASMEDFPKARAHLDRASATTYSASQDTTCVDSIPEYLRRSDTDKDHLGLKASDSDFDLAQNDWASLPTKVFLDIEPEATHLYKASTALPCRCASTCSTGNPITSRSQCLPVPFAANAFPLLLRR